MPTVDPSDRNSLEGAYPLEAFERDAACNARADAAELHGVRLAPSVAAAGRFELTRATRGAGESQSGQSDNASLFLAPHRTDEGAVVFEAWPGYGGPQAVEAFPSDPPGRDYASFLDRIAETARTARFPSPVGLHDERLKGFRGG